VLHERIQEKLSQMTVRDCIKEGSAFNGALFHARRRLELDSDNLRYKEFLLFFHSVPDDLINDEEAMQICLEILEQDPTNKCALRTLEQMDRFYAKNIRPGTFIEGNFEFN
jgi:hypothetical protein